MKSSDEQNTNPDIYLAAVRRNWRTLEHLPEDLRDEKRCMAAVQQYGMAPKYVPEAVQLAHPHICVAAVKRDDWAMRYVPKNVRMAHPGICVAAVKQYGWALRYVPEELKTNVEALAKLYTNSQEQLIIDLLSLEINDDVINQVICSLKAPIAKSSSMMEQLLGTGNDSKQPAEHHVNSRDVIPAALLPTIEGYVYTPSNQENDAKESKGLSPL